MKWVVSSFGAVAAALVVGVQLTSLGHLSGERLDWALVSAGVVFASVLIILMAAVRVLVPRGGTYHGFQSDRDFKALREELTRDPTPLRQRANTAAGLADLYEQAVGAERSAWELWEAEKESPTLAEAYEMAKEQRANLFPVVEAVTNLGLYLRVRQLFRQTILAIYVGIALAAAGAVAFAYFANPPSKPAPPAAGPSVHVAVNEPKTCVDLYLALDMLAKEAPGIGSHWPTRSLGAQDHACGFRTEGELAHFFSFLARR